jgi:hypothetical protein
MLVAENKFADLTVAKEWTVVSAQEQLVLALRAQIADKGKRNPKKPGVVPPARIEGGPSLPPGTPSKMSLTTTFSGLECPLRISTSVLHGCRHILIFPVSRNISVNNVNHVYNIFKMLFHNAVDILP